MYSITWIDADGTAHTTTSTVARLARDLADIATTGRDIRATWHTPDGRSWDVTIGEGGST